MGRNVINNATFSVVFVGLNVLSMRLRKVVVFSDLLNGRLKQMMFLFLVELALDEVLVSFELELTWYVNGSL